MTSRLCQHIALCWLALFCGNFLTANAHEVRPAYLELVEQSAGNWAVTWKQPLKDGQRLKIDPIFPEDCTQSNERVTSVGGTLIRRWTLSCSLTDGAIAIEGLSRTLTDAFLKIERLDGENSAAVLRPEAPSIELSEAIGAPTATYLWIGVEHIIFGYDHLLFVLGLFLLVRPRQLFLTVTAFTVAHSLTLGLSALAGISLPGAPVEIVIALSIALLGVEAINRYRGYASLSLRFPWVIAFGFGLIHGFGFAGALSEIGLPKGAELMALMLFNIGVELGQIAFLCVLLAAQWVLVNVSAKAERPLQTALAYMIGITGMFWAFERISATFFL